MMRAPLLAFLLLNSVVSFGASSPPYLNARPMLSSDARQAIFETADYARTLSVDRVFLITLSKSFEPYARVGYLLRGDSVEKSFVATDLLPNGSYAVGTAGQMFGAALLDDQKTLAISIGWTNAKGRNVAGIAVLRLTASEWTVQRIIALPGVARDLAAGPGNTIVAVTNDSLQIANHQKSALITMFDTNGVFLGELMHGWTQSSIEDAADEAISTTLERAGNEYAVLVKNRGMAYFFRIERTAECPAPLKQTDSRFVYPTFDHPCMAGHVSWLTAFAIPPAESAAMKSVSIRAVHFTGKTVIVAREGYDGQRVHLFVTNYAGPDGGQSWEAEGLWRAIRITDEGLEAMEVGEHANSLVRLATPHAHTAD